MTKWTSPGLSSDRLRGSLRRLVGPVEQAEGQAARVPGVERPHRHDSRFGARWPAIVQFLEERADRWILIPVRQDEEDRGASGGRVSSTSSAALSASPHWTSSMQTTKGSRRVSIVNTSRRAKKARCRTTRCPKTVPDTSSSMLATRSRTGNTRASKATSLGRSNVPRFPSTWRR